MSDKAEKKPDAPAEGAPAAKAEEKKKGGGFLTKTPVLLGGVMVIEAAALIGGFKIFGGKPQSAEAALVTPNPAADAAKKKTIEVPVVDFKALNRSNGHTFLFDISIVAVTKADNEQKVTDTFKDSKALIEDRLRTIIAESDPEKLSGGTEPGLETLRRQVKYQLDRILGDGVIDEVLVPRCIPYRTDF